MSSDQNGNSENNKPNGDSNGNSGSNSSGNPKGNGSAQQQDSHAFLLQQLYVKDASFEAPNTPQIFQESNIEPETELNIRTSHNGIGENLYEVVLHIRVHAKRKADTIFLAELDQAGVFAIQGYDPQEIGMLLGTQCPATLFPYAREAISSIVGRGGFPPLILQPINFDALYSRAREQQATQPQQEQ